MELQALKKVGPKTLSLLNKLNIYTIEDLINYYPYRYNIYKPLHLKDVKEGDTVTINAVIETAPNMVYIRKNLTRISFQALCDDVNIKVAIFNRNYLNACLSIGKEVTLIGKYNAQKNSFMASDIKLGGIKNTKIEPVYHIIKGLKNANMNTYILEALENYHEPILDLIPEQFNKKYHFSDKLSALKEIHHPKNIKQLKQAQLKFIYEELFLFMLKINLLKAKNEKMLGLAHSFNEEKVTDFINHLPFTLTTDQKKAVFDCLSDLKSPKRMNRLIEGDVGSGKTIVATIVMYANTLSGYQSALMAPTEILAIQHYETIKKIMSPYGVRVELLTGSLKSSDRQRILMDLKNAKIDILIGTHSLIGENVTFANLGLVITDEQHRFGVNQRSNLQNKGHLPDIIYMSATPIPRTYALTIYNDMETSIIRTKPKGRKEIQTFVKKESELKSVLESIWAEIKKGHQIYVVAPSIQESEEKEGHDVASLKKSFDKAFQGKVPTAILHGKISPREKEKIMASFKAGEIKILIATTVIEVGVDVENATMIVIFDAECYGLATLHQLRGRVGRNEFDSYCYLISDKEVDRLRVLEQSNDGFYISEQDFLMRSGGDIFGTKQSGDMVFKVADLRRDYKILLQAKKDSAQFLKTEEIKQDKYQKIIKSIVNLD